MVHLPSIGRALFPQYRKPARTRFVNEKVIKIALRDPVCVYSGRFLTQ